jgi:hypothetical protein
MTSFDSVITFFENKDDWLRENLLKFKNDIAYLTDLYNLNSMVLHPVARVSQKQELRTVEFNELLIYIINLTKQISSCKEMI